MTETYYKIKYDNKVFWGKCEKKELMPLKYSIYENLEVDRKVRIPLKDCQILAPCDPKTIVGLAYNYKSLVGELPPGKTEYEEPLFFLKAVSSLLNPIEPIRISCHVQKTWVEVELAVVIKKECKAVAEEKAHSYILGFSVGNDVTSENLYKRDHHLARSKSLETYCPIGPCLVRDIEVHHLNLQTIINGRIFQKGNTNDMIYSPSKCVSLVSQYIRLFPGDVILTGTMANAENSIICPGDIVEQEIESVGILRSTVVS